MRSLAISFLLLAGCARGPVSRPSPSVEVALTVDDLPRHGPVVAPWSRVGFAQHLVKVFRAHGVPPVYGFINGANALDDEGQAVLAAWKAGGQRFGNHSWAHRNLDDVSVEDYLADLEKNEPLLAQLEPDPHGWRVYRYPFLHEGNTLEKRRAVHLALAQRHYRIAEVSIDADDWAFSAPLARCLEKGDSAQAAALREDFVAAEVEELGRMRALSQQLVGRDIRHVVLLHLGLADAEALEALLTAFEARGVKWVSLDRALEDPFYAEQPDLAFKAGAAFPYVVAKAKGVKVGPPIYARGLEERLETICR